MRAPATGARTLDHVPRSTDHDLWATGLGPIDCLICERVRHRVLRTGHVIGRPACTFGQAPACRGPQRDELRILDAPAAGELLHDQLRVEEQVHLLCPELARQVERTHDAGVFGDVVGLDAEVLGDPRVGSCSVVARIGPPQVVERRPERCRARIAARGPVRANDETGRRRARLRRLEVREQRVGQGRRSGVSRSLRIPARSTPGCAAGRAAARGRSARRCRRATAAIRTGAGRSNGPPHVP